MQQAIGRVALVIIACALERHESVVSALSDALDVHDWEGPADLPYFGIRNAISYASGLEIVAPLGEQSAISEHLQVRGEGVYGVVFGVKNLEQALHRAVESGLGRAEPLGGRPGAGIIDSLTANGGGPVFPSYPKRFARHQEVILNPLVGVQWILGQIEPIA